MCWNKPSPAKHPVEAKYQVDWENNKMKTQLYGVKPQPACGLAGCAGRYIMEKAKA